MTEPFSRRAAGLAAGDLLALERETGQGERFEQLDHILGKLITAAIHGTPIIEAANDKLGDSVSLLDLDASEHAYVHEHFALEHQQERGAWYLPERVRVRTGKINFISAYRRSPRFGASLIAGDGASLPLEGSPEALFAWALLEPFFEALFQPIELRLTTTKSRENQLKAWADVDQMLAALQLDLDAELATMRYGGGWSRLTAAEKTEARQRLLDALASQGSHELAARYRSFRLATLIERFYKKAKKGSPTRRQVLTKADERTLSGFFDGDWLALLAYLGEQPAPGEEIVTVLPEPRLYTGAGVDERVERVATAQNLPAAEVERMLAALWNQEDAVSPVNARVRALTRFWQVFDELHARQAPGMPSLWGLTEEGPLLPFGDERDSPFSRGIYRQLLPADLLADIHDLWGTTMLSRWPEHIVSSLSPIETMADALGPALHFWHGCALTAWFLCEGPYSRTDMAGLARYHAADLQSLEQLGCPVAGELFNELVAAEARLPEPQPIYDQQLPGEESIVSPNLPFAMTVRMQISTKSRRDGFEQLRDIITRHRRRWAGRHLGDYLRSRWQMELREAAREHSRFIAAKGKPPTAKQFAKTAATAANRWQGGDLAALYTAIGEKSPITPARAALVPDDHEAFVRAVFDELGGEPFKRYRVVEDREAGRRQQEESNRYNRIRELAEASLRYLQLEEALGQPPDKQQFGRRKFDPIAAELWGDPEHGWSLYRAAIERARHTPLIAPLPLLEPDAVEPKLEPVRFRRTPSARTERSSRSFLDRLRGR